MHTNFDMLEEKYIKYIDFSMIEQKYIKNQDTILILFTLEKASNFLAFCQTQIPSNVH